MKNVEIFCNCRLGLSGILSFIGPVLAIFTFLLLSTEIPADDFSGRVIGPSDRGTFSVMHNKRRAEKIRLYGIDAPEKGQAFCNRAKQFVSALVFGKEVKVGAKDKTVTGGQWLT